MKQKFNSLHTIPKICRLILRPMSLHRKVRRSSSTECSLRCQDLTYGLDINVRLGGESSMPHPSEFALLMPRCQSAHMDRSLNPVARHGFLPPRFICGYRRTANAGVIIGIYANKSYGIRLACFDAAASRGSIHPISFVYLDSWWLI